MGVQNCFVSLAEMPPKASLAPVGQKLAGIFFCELQPQPIEFLVEIFWFDLHYVSSPAGRVKFSLAHDCFHLKQRRPQIRDDLGKC